MSTVFRPIMRLLAWLYERTIGRFGGRVQGLPVLLLMTTGRKPGRLRKTPLGYIVRDGSYVVTATNAGSDRHPGWYHNLRVDPHVRLQIQDRQTDAQAVVAEPELREQLWRALVQLAPGYRAYEKRTAREIPMVLLTPETPVN